MYIQQINKCMYFYFLLINSFELNVDTNTCFLLMNISMNMYKHNEYLFSYTLCGLPKILLFQAYLLFGDVEYLFIFQEAYATAMHYLYNDPW